MLEVEVYEYLREKGLNYLYWRYGIKNEVADDVIHDTYLGVLVAIRKGTKIEDMKKYTNTVMKFVVCQLFERGRNNKEFGDKVKRENIVHESGGERERVEEIYEGEKKEILGRVVKRLNRREQVVFNIVMEGKDPREFGEMNAHGYVCIKGRIKDKLKGFVEREIYGN